MQKMGLLGGTQGHGECPFDTVQTARSAVLLLLLQVSAHSAACGSSLAWVRWCSRHTYTDARMEVKTRANWRSQSLQL